MPLPKQQHTFNASYLGFMPSLQVGENGSFRMEARLVGLELDKLKPTRLSPELHTVHPLIVVGDRHVEDNYYIF